MHFFQKSTLAFLACIILLLSVNLYAQASKEQNKQFMDLMLSFPSGFTTIKGAPAGYKGDSSSFYSKVNISGTRYCRMERNDITGKLEYHGMILADEESSYSVFEKAFEDWKKVIASLDFNGAKLAPFNSDKYEGDDMYDKTAAWRLDAAKFDLDLQYKTFTIWLLLLDLDQGGLMVKLLVTDN